SRQAMMRLVSMSVRAKVAQYGKANLAGFFRVKLHSKQVLTLDCGRKLAPVFAPGYSFGGHGNAKGVRKIGKGLVGNVTKQARMCGDFQLVPSHVRRLHRGWKMFTLAAE